MIRRVFWVLILVGAAGAGAWGYVRTQERSSAPKYKTAAVERGSLTSVISASGTVNAVVTVQVGSQVSGQISELLADFNTPVKRGQIIARLEPDMFAARADQARADVDSQKALVLNQEAQLERARADVENAVAALAEAKANTLKSQVAVIDAKRDLDRKNELARRDLIAKADRDTSQTAHDSSVALVDAAKAREHSVAAGIRSAQAQRRVAEAMLASSRAQVKQKQAALQQALVDLDHATIRAPVDGIVVARSVDVGQTVAASLQAPTLFTIAQDLTQMRVETSVPESDVGRIKVGDAATFTVDAFANSAFSGRVVQIRQAAQNVQNVITYTVLVDVANPGGKLMPGMTANVKMIVAERPNVLKVPNLALRFRPSDADGKAEKTASLGPAAVAAGPPPAGGDSAESSDVTADRLARELGLSDDQRTRVDAIAQESRKQRRALRDSPLSAADRKQRTREIRDDAQRKIREVLTVEQRLRYDEMAIAGNGESGTPGRVWVMDGGVKPTPVTVTLGLSDGSATEILNGDLKEGQHVVVGVVGAKGGTRPGSGSRESRMRL